MQCPTRHVWCVLSMAVHGLVGGVAQVLRETGLKYQPWLQPSLLGGVCRQGVDLLAWRVPQSLGVDQSPNNLTVAVTYLALTSGQHVLCYHQTDQH